MQTFDPHLMSTVVALWAVVLMIHSGIANRLLSWRSVASRRPRSRRLRIRRGRSRH